MVNPLIVIQQNKNSDLETMKEDRKTLRSGLVLSNAKTGEADYFGLPCSRRRESTCAVLKIWMALIVLQKFLSLLQL